MGFFLGVDVGGSKSQALIADESGRVVGFGKGGVGNWEAVGYDGLAQVLKTVTSQALEMAGLEIAQISGAGFGIAGFDWPCQIEDHRQAILSLGLGSPFEFVNDTLIGLYAGAEEPWGVAVVSGTGCNCWGINRQGTVGRVTGEGTLMGEEGGSGSLIERAIHSISRQWSRRGPPTRLTDAFLDRTGAGDVITLLEGLVLGRYPLSADDVLTVFRLAEEGDRVAEEIVAWNGIQLADLASGVISQLDLEAETFEVILVGSLFKAGERMIGPMRTAIQTRTPGAQLVVLPTLPVVGGVVLGMKSTGIDPRPVRPVLIASIQEAAIQ